MTNEDEDARRKGDDPGMAQFWTMLQHLDQTIPPGDGFVQLMNLLERQSELVSYKTSINTHDIFTA